MQMWKIFVLLYTTLLIVKKNTESQKEKAAVGSYKMNYSLY